jgi:hypothetical protein
MRVDQASTRPTADDDPCAAARRQAAALLERPLAARDVDRAISLVKELRACRQFDAMTRLAEAVLRWRPDDFLTRSRYAQGCLIAPFGSTDFFFSAAFAAVLARIRGCLRGRCLMIPPHDEFRVRPRSVSNRGLQGAAPGISRWPVQRPGWTPPLLVGDEVWRDRVCYAAMVVVPASKGFPLFHIACRTTASLRATATTARLKPIRARRL